MLNVSQRQEPPRHRPRKKASTARRILPKIGFWNLKDKQRRGEVVGEKTFREAAEQFLREYEIITEGRAQRPICRGPRPPAETPSAAVLWSDGPLGSHLRQAAGVPHPPARTGDGGSRQAACAQYPPSGNRHASGRCSKPPSAMAGCSICRICPSPSARRGKSRTARGSLRRNTRHSTKRRASARRNPKRKRYLWECEQLHDYVLFMANTGLRPDEAARFEYRDVKIVRDDATERNHP